MIYFLTHPEKAEGRNPGYTPRGLWQAEAQARCLRGLETDHHIHPHCFTTIARGEDDRYKIVAQMICKRLKNRHIRLLHSSLLGDGLSTHFDEQGVSVMTSNEGSEELRATHLWLEPEFFDAPRWIQKKLDEPYERDKAMIGHGRFAELLGLCGKNGPPKSGSIWELHLDRKPPFIGRLLMDQGELMLDI